MEIALNNVMQAARQRRAALTAEGAGYIVFLALGELTERPRPVSAATVLLNDSGDVSLVRGEAIGALEIELGLRRLLGSLLELGPSPPPALRAAAERRSCGDLAAYARELGAALIPLNHAAARRALARLYRETVRASVVQEDADAAGSTPNVTEALTRMPLAEAATVASSALEYPRADWMRAGRQDLELDIDVDVDADAAPRCPPAVGAVAPVSHAMLHEERGFALDEECPGGLQGESHRPLREPSAPSERTTQGPEALEGGSMRRSRISLAPGVLVESAANAPRSDVRELLANFLSHTRSEENLQRELRRMVSLGNRR
jgi:hypothetical protein